MITIDKMTIGMIGLAAGGNLVKQGSDDAVLLTVQNLQTFRTFRPHADMKKIRKHTWNEKLLSE